MKFSELFEVTRAETDDWFDPILGIDTKLFIDPFLIYADETGHFAGSHAEVIAFFDHAFNLIAKTRGDRHSNSWRLAKSLLVFPEASEFCLGYTKNGTRGAGSGSGFAKTIAESLWEAVQTGVKELTHFEEIGLLREGIGADRIADITATLLKHRFAAYTQEVCNKLKIPTIPQRYKRGLFSPKAHTWIPATFHLPVNIENGSPLILTPERFLRELPTINASSFWDYCFDNVNEQLRAEFSADVLKHVKKTDIVQFASKHPELRLEYIKSTEGDRPEPYDLKNDPKGYFRWHEDSANYCKDNPLKTEVVDASSFEIKVKEIVAEYINYIENNSGWRLLWNDNKTPKREEAAQLLFLGLVKHYCKAENIDISKEVNIGRGPVDFKMSTGYSLRTLLELKLAKNTKFWNGLEKQLPIYLKSEGVKFGFFLIIVYTDNDIKKLNGIRERVKVIKNKTGYDIAAVTIDARRNPVSASKA